MLKYLKVIGVIFIWLGWPFIYGIALLMVSGIDQCMMDGGCPEPWWEEALIFIGLFGPPIIVSILWIYSE